MVMEVEIRQGVCNNSPTEWISPENGWRLSLLLKLDQQCITIYLVKLSLAE